MVPDFTKYPLVMTKNANPRKTELILAYMAIGVTGISLLSIMLTLMLELFGISDKPALFAQLPLIGLPVGFMLILALLVVSLIRRRREN